MSKLLWTFFLLVAFACNQEEKAQTPGAGRHDIAVKPLDEAGLSKLTTNRDGKALLLNVWATWCVPCKEEFPDLVRLAGKYQDNGYEFAAVSVDYPDEVDSKITPFLRQIKPNFPIYVRDFDDEQAFINSLNEQWSGALPATFIFDATGKQRAFLQGKQDYISLERALQAVVVK